MNHLRIDRMSPMMQYIVFNHIDNEHVDIA